MDVEWEIWISTTTSWPNPLKSPIRGCEDVSKSYSTFFLDEHLFTTENRCSPRIGTGFWPWFSPITTSMCSQTTSSKPQSAGCACRFSPCFPPSFPRVSPVFFPDVHPQIMNFIILIGFSIIIHPSIGVHPLWNVPPFQQVAGLSCRQKTHMKHFRRWTSTGRTGTGWPEVNNPCACPRMIGINLEFWGAYG